MSKSLLFLALVSLTIVPPLRADSTLPEEAKAAIDAAVNQVLSSTKVPSASIAIVKDGRIAYLQAYGLARLSPPMEATPQMQYPIGSIRNISSLWTIPSRNTCPNWPGPMTSPSACSCRTRPVTRTTGLRTT
jgi:hypothetical protein